VVEARPAADAGAPCSRGRRARSAAAVAVVASRVRVEERRLFAALERRRVVFAHLDDRALSARIGLAQERPSWDVVLNRSISASRRAALSRLYEAWGIPVVNSSDVVTTCDDKLATTLVLGRAGVPVPPTAVALAPDGGLDAIESIGYPVVLKPVNGSWGRLVSKLNDRDAAEAVLAHRRALSSPAHGIVYAQRFVDGRDVRAIVVGDAVVGAVHRRSRHWVRNTAQSGEATACPVTPQLEEICLRAAAAVGGGALAIDLLESDQDGLWVSEVNSGMEFSGFSRATGVDVAAILVDFALAQARRA
jgi:[lysine-biosynthesis-protein LysW]--L-2-aminoadipate ligase